MTPKRMFFAMLGVVVLLLALCGVSTYFAQKLIVDQGSKLTAHKLEQEVLDRQVTSLQQAKQDIAEYESLELIARSVVPQDKDQARTVLELVQIASRHSITITGVTFPDSQLGQGSGKKKTADPKLTQLTPLDSPKGVYAMEIMIETDPDDPVSYEQLVGFLDSLENNRRTAQVTNISINPDSDNRNIVTFALSLTSYVKP